MSENLSIWNTLGRTSPEHTKGFSRAGGFRGTAVKPIYTEQKMTEMFGPCGIGWGFTEPTFQLVPGSDGQTAVYCWLSLWYVHDGARSQSIPGVGGDMVIVKQSSGLRTDDEAFKKAFTDAIGNAMKHLGMSADVHMGRFDDSKYVNDLKREDAEANQESAPAPGRNTVVTSGIKPAHSVATVPLSEADQDTLVSATKSAGKLFATDQTQFRNWWVAQIPKVKPNLSPDRFENLKSWVAAEAIVMPVLEAAE